MKAGTYVRGDLAILEAGFAALDQAVLVHDKNGMIVACNPAAARLAGRPVDEILGLGTSTYEQELHYVDGTPVTCESSRLLRCIRTGEADADVLVEIRDPGGVNPRWVSVSYQPLIHEGEDEPWGCVSSIVQVGHPADLSDEVKARIESAPVALLGIDADGRISYANRSARAIAAECDDLQLAIDAREPLARFFDDDELSLRAALDAGRRLSLTRYLERPDGDDMWLAIEVAPNDGDGGALCCVRDVTEEREREQELSHQAFHDSLTGLPNRRFTEEQLALGLTRARRQGGGLGVVFIDIDGFKQVNDQLGHTAGDDLLIEFANRLAATVRESDAVGRLADPGSMVARRGGDEFVLVLADLPADCAHLVARAMQRVEAALETPFPVADRHLDLSASLGAAVYPYDSHDARTLLEMASSAMRAVKRERRRVRLAEPEDTG
ncbi:MAG: diguanylate cyclase domain-containing protein [Thermoleophilaceae bacterium]